MDGLATRGAPLLSTDRLVVLARLGGDFLVREADLAGREVVPVNRLPGRSGTLLAHLVRARNEIEVGSAIAAGWPRP